MKGAHGMLVRVRRLERSNVSPMLRFIGSMDKFAAHAEAGMIVGLYDMRDMPTVIKSVCRWLTGTART